MHMLNTPVMFLLPSYTETTTTTTKCVFCYNIRSVNICDVDVTYNHFCHLCLWYLLTEVDHLWVSTVRCDIDFFSPLIIFTTQSKENSNWKRKLSFWFSCYTFQTLARKSLDTVFFSRPLFLAIIGLLLRWSTSCELLFHSTVSVCQNLLLTEFVTECVPECAAVHL